MPPGYEPLLAAVCAAPWDDLPRLVFADWLDDHGWRARAEFIRLQCAAARGGSDARACQSRADHLMHRHKWHRRERPVLDGVMVFQGYHRGFVAAAALNAEPSADRLAAVTAAFPLHRLRVVGAAGEGFAGVAGSPHLGGIKRLEVWYADDDWIASLTANVAVRRLEQLALSGMAHWRNRPALTDRAADLLADCPHLARLRWLRVSYVAMSSTARTRLTARFGRHILIHPQPG